LAQRCAQEAGEIDGCGGGVLIRDDLLSILNSSPGSRPAKVAVRLLSVLLLLLLSMGLGWSALDAFPGLLGPPPCTSEGSLLAIKWGLPASFVAAIGILGLAYRRCTPWLILIGVLLPSPAWVMKELAVSQNNMLQKSCASWSVDEAVRQCNVNPSVIVRKDIKSETGGRYTQLTLMAPGKTDTAWTCLGDWFMHSRVSASLRIDESVYLQAQKEYRDRQKR